MSKKESATSIAKVSLLQVLPPSLSSTVRTSQFPLECFGDALHLAAPQPLFERDHSQGWYSGIPISMIAVVTNKRFQVLKNVSITVQARIGKHQLLQKDHKFDGEIRAQKWTTFPFSVSCPIGGDLEIIATLHFSFEDLPQVLRVSEIIRIKQTLDMKYSMRQKPTEVIQFSAYNGSPFQLSNIRASTLNGTSFPVAEGLGPNESVSSFFKPKGQATRLEIAWDLPHAKKCTQVIALKVMPEEPVAPVVVDVTDLPEVVPCLKPFVVHVKVRSTKGEKITGRIAFNQSEQLIRIVGKTALSFTDVVEKEFELTLVSLWQGALQLPAFVVHLSDNSTVPCDVNKGLLVVGYADE